ncbi:AraC-binding-like domain-containing protein [Bradyrhizobium lablabi]|uniref:AraC-binding-like domain-containing protein n=1 Tax=Bradyrhizobium lablabi TaxID=722472 RepID=A0A1M7AB10_9BRAD|nr:hypothetical protein [Bradyrhizobium lablabi]SHL39852.1 AraC-binding-like domain-containing protein [Bradyrhizobium lablabi]
MRKRRQDPAEVLAVLNLLWPAGDTDGEWALNEVREGHSVTSAAGDFHVHRFSSDDVAERDRLAFVREVYGRVIVKHYIEPHADSPFRCRTVLRRLPGLGLASIDCSGIHTERTPAQIDSDDLVLHVRSAGKGIVRQFGREAVAGAGELAVTRSSDAASCDYDPGSRLLHLKS